jgi:hypothetical protein
MLDGGEEQQELRACTIDAMSSQEVQLVRVVGRREFNKLRSFAAIQGELVP